MSIRTLVLICAAAGIPLALLALVLPITWGYGGYNFIPGAPYSRVYFSDPSGPAYAAGLRVGQRLVSNKGNEYVQEDAGPVGTVVHEHVVESNGGVRVVSFAFVPFTGALGAQQLINKLVNGLTALGAFIVAILVLMRARNQRVGTRAAAVLFFSGAAALSLSGSYVCGNAWCAEILNKFLPPSFGVAAYWSALLLLAIYPPERTKLRAALSWFGAAQAARALLAAYSSAAFIATGVGHPLADAIAFGAVGQALSLVFTLVMVIAIFDAFASASSEDAAPVRWLGGMWLVAAAFSAAPAIEVLAGGTSLETHYGDFVNAAQVLFFAFGVAYPVLRHRLVDLNILVSRATVFTLVSVIIVGVFIAAEWGIAKIFEQSFGLSHDKSGLAAQLLTLVIVLVLGMSARSIHRFVEERLTRAFFRKRLQGLTEIERVAREADAATDASDLMQLGVQTVKHALSPLGVAYYLHRGDRYERGAEVGAGNFPQAYRFNDGVPLRLRRWQEAFEVDDDSGEHLHMLFVPMTVRGDLVGFLCCGPKPDRTAYLEDEIKALSLLAHHTAIATALLPHVAPDVSEQALTRTA
ncbi:MAG TPA: GAF domain-containing protein [Candidatus Baltobacteraceae bacterium]|nr:GAF domain-containing protein [Candidatus Baltobacteraceae bacterium]